MEHPSSSSSSWFVNRVGGNGSNETNVMDVGTFFSLTNPSLVQQNNNNNNDNTDQQLHLHSQNQSTTINSVALIEHLQQLLQQEQARRIETEKELNCLKQKYMELQREINETKALQKNSLSMQCNHLESIKKRLINTLNMAIDSNDHHQSHKLLGTNQSQYQIEYIHECDECQFKTKSNVSLILHKMNHQITDQHYILSTTSFTTRNSNSKSIYKCSACDTDQLTRHQVYRHIYDLHTAEKPLSCPYCEFTFTHNDYLKQHIPIKHGKTSFTSLSSLSKSPHNNGLIHHNNSNSLSGSNNSCQLLTTTITEVDPSSSSSPTYELQSSNRSRNKRQSTSKNVSQTDLKCTFPDCNFVTIFPSTLEFHLQAHLTTKYKCPYCPYVANAIVDIKRHIQKNKKHEGMKMYSCQKCSFAADCDRLFKEHLRSYHFGYEATDAVIDYFIEEMFSNKNKQRPSNDDPENINKAINSTDKNETVIAINSITMNTNNNNGVQKQLTNEVSLTPPSVKKFAGLKDHQQCLVTADNNITNQNQRQTLNIQIANDRNAGQNSQTFYNLELTTSSPVSSSNVPLLFTSARTVSGENQQLSTSTIKSIPFSAVTIVPEQHHQLHGQQPQTATILSVPSDTNLNDLLNHHATLISVEEPMSNNNRAHHQQSTNSQENGGQDSSSLTGHQLRYQIIDFM